MGRIDPYKLKLAKARVKLCLGDTYSRTSGRFVRPSKSALILEPAVLLAATDPELKDRVFNFAAAALNGHEIARAINAEEKRMIIDMIGADARSFAMKNRKFSRMTAAEGTFEERFRATKDECAHAFDFMLAGMRHPDLGHCINVALSSVMAEVK